ncbi:hypothetical protein PENSPDRAFT_751834 [Peniophora sp. CONT]|nr:hypothetical protein PENSPDRAFT_751834 [Peniophora sp. CONT]
MKFTSTITALAAVIAVEATSRLGKRQFQGGGNECAGARSSMVAYDRAFVYPLFQACATQLGHEVASRENPWVNKDCVAAAVAASVPIFHDGLTCDLNTTVPADEALSAQSTWPSLDYNVYASIVGDCAWAEGGCPITEQNFIDLVYGAISDTTQGPYPDSAQQLIDDYIQPIFDWTAFDISAGIPYTNFNDWLHYSPETEHCNPGECT